MLFRRSLGGLGPKKTATSALANGLVSWWPMQEASGFTREDFVGTNDLGNSFGAITQVTGHVEAFASGFDGGEHHGLFCDDNPTLAFHQPWSLLCWIKLGAYPPTTMGWFGKQFTEFRAHVLGNNIAPGVVQCSFAGQDVYWGTIPDPTQWAMTVTFYDPAGDCGGSLNGGVRSVQAVNPATGIIPDGSNTFWIGQNQTSGGPATAHMGPCALWNRILTDSETAHLWNGGAGRALGAI